MAGGNNGGLMRRLHGNTHLLNLNVERLDTFLAQRFVVIATVIATASTPFVNLG